MKPLKKSVKTLVFRASLPFSMALSMALVSCGDASVSTPMNQTEFSPLAQGNLFKTGSGAANPCDIGIGLTLSNSGEWYRLNVITILRDPVGCADTGVRMAVAPNPRSYVVAPGSVKQGRLGETSYIGYDQAGNQMSVADYRQAQYLGPQFSKWTSQEQTLGESSTLHFGYKVVSL